MSISRREFLETTALGGVAATSGLGLTAGKGNALPSRVLGRTGVRVSILAFGCGSRFLQYKEEDKALEALNRALDLGITYIDTAASYGNGRSEERVGKVLKTRGKGGLFLATKVNRRKGDEAMRAIEASLKRLQLDQVDLLHIHQLSDEQDLAAIEAKDGVLNVLYKLRDQKVARFIGVTCHKTPAVLKTALERHDFDCTQMALNAGLAVMTDGKGGFEALPMPRGSFEELALPVALRKKMGVTAMKVFAQDKLAAQAPAEKLVRYAMSLPVATAVIGMPKPEHIEQNVEIARNFRPMSREEMRSLAQELSAKHSASLYRFFQNHRDA